MRRLSLAVLALTLAAGTAHAEVPFKLKALVRLDAIRNKLTGQPRHYKEGSIVVDKKFEFHPLGDSTTVTNQYYIGYRGDVKHLSQEIRHRDIDGETNKVIEDKFAVGDRKITSIHLDRSRTQEYTTFSGEGKARARRRTVTRELAPNGKLELLRLADHRTGELEVRVFNQDGTMTVKHSLESRDRAGNVHEEVLSLKRVPAPKE